MPSRLGTRDSNDRCQQPDLAMHSYGTHLHTVLVHGTLEALFFKKGTLYESYVLNPPAVNQLRDVNTNFRIDYTFQ